MSAQDQKCGTCAFRVNELRRSDTPYEAGSTMVCLHPAVVRQDCKQARLSANGKCGTDADLWVRRAEQTSLVGAA